MLSEADQDALIAKARAAREAEFQLRRRREQVLSIGLCPDCGGFLCAMGGFIRFVREKLWLEKMYTCKSCGKRHKLFLDDC
jgi:hypothetical protein